MNTFQTPLTPMALFMNDPIDQCPHSPVAYPPLLMELIIKQMNHSLISYTHSPKTRIPQLPHLSMTYSLMTPFH